MQGLHHIGQLDNAMQSIDAVGQNKDISAVGNPEAPHRTLQEIGVIGVAQVMHCGELGCKLGL